MSIDLRELAQPANPELPDFGPGDTIRVLVRVVEGDRERLQPFEGVVIRVKNGPAGNFTVRRIASGVGVERTFPFNSPRVEQVEVTRRGRVRRARQGSPPHVAAARGQAGQPARPDPLFEPVPQFAR